MKTIKWNNSSNQHVRHASTHLCQILKVMHCHCGFCVVCLLPSVIFQHKCCDGCIPWKYNKYIDHRFKCLSCFNDMVVEIKKASYVTCVAVTINRVGSRCFASQSQIIVWQPQLPRGNCLFSLRESRWCSDRQPAIPRLWPLTWTYLCLGYDREE